MERIKNVVKGLAVLLTAIGVVTLIAQAVTISIYWEWLHDLDILIEGYDNKIYYMSTLAVILCWIFIAVFDGIPEDEWNGFFILIAVTALLGIAEIIQVNNLNMVMFSLQEKAVIDIEQYNIIDYTTNIMCLSSLVAVVLKIYFVQKLQTVDSKQLELNL